MIDTTFKSMLIGNPSKHLKTSYAETLLFPEHTCGAKVPGMADATVSLHRKTTLSITTGALGAAGIIWFPAFLTDNTANYTTFFLNNNATYDGVTTIGTTNALGISTPQSVTSGAVGQYRLVSAAMHIIPQSSVLNQAGSIHAALVKTGSSPAALIGAAAPNSTITLLPNFQNTPYYREASVSALEGARVIWLPNDECLLEFSNININVYNNGQNDQTNAIVVDIIGTAAAAPFRIDLYWNFEVTPVPGSILLGMESIARENVVATQVWRQILVDHGDDIVLVNKAISNTVAIKHEQQKPQRAFQTQVKNGITYTTG